MFEEPKPDDPKNTALVVDDNMFNTFSFRELLSKKFNIQSTEAHNGEQGVKKVLDRKQNKENPYFKVIFMDLDMPIMNGYEASRQIKGIEKRNLIIAVTGAPVVENKDQLFAEVLKKPVGFEVL